MVKKIMIYGAGALGRGFLAPIFSRLGYEVSFVDKNPCIIAELKRRDCYITPFIINHKYSFQKVRYKNAFLFGEEDSILPDMDIAVSAVGVRNLVDIAKKIKNIPLVFSFENERNSAIVLARFSGNKNCYFGIPDVITSNTAPRKVLEKDMLSVVSEQGEIILEKGNYEFPREIKQLEAKRLEEYWACKFYLHNTLHAAIAYLGWKYRVKYIHEAIRIPEVYKIVSDILDNLKLAMTRKGLVNSALANLYSTRELERFRDELLFDPIERVAREPLRKLRANDRLISALRLIHETNGDVLPLCEVIRHVFDYDNPKSNDDIIELRKRIGEEGILRSICKISREDPLFPFIVSSQKIMR